MSSKAAWVSNCVHANAVMSFVVRYSKECLDPTDQILMVATQKKNICPMLQE